MGNSQSSSPSTAALPSSIDGLWRMMQQEAVVDDHTPFVTRFKIPKYDKAYLKTTLSVDIPASVTIVDEQNQTFRNSKLLLDCSRSGLQLRWSSPSATTADDNDGQQQDNLIGICKRQQNGTFHFYKYEPSFPGQVPTKQPANPIRRSKGPSLYLYATISRQGHVSFVHQPDKVAFVVESGPKNSGERSLLQVSSGDVVAEGTENGPEEEEEADTLTAAAWTYRDHYNHVEVFDNVQNLPLVFCLVVISDLLEANARMNQLGKTAAIGSMIPT